jgi:hypothetical protein
MKGVGELGKVGTHESEKRGEQLSPNSCRPNLSEILVDLFLRSASRFFCLET